MVDTDAVIGAVLAIVMLMGIGIVFAYIDGREDGMKLLHQGHYECVTALDEVVCKEIK